MIVYRIAKKQFINDLSGEGARIFGGRWNKKGNSTVYTAENRALAAIESLVHVQPNLWPEDSYMAEIRLPNDSKSYCIDIKEDLPENWQQYPAPSVLGDITENIFQEKNVLFISVPSIVVKWEWNVIINPKHEDMKKVEIMQVEKFEFDKRLRKV